MQTAEIIRVILCFLGSMIGTYLIMPRIIAVAKYRKLADNPNKRSSHTNLTPRLGGVAFYICFMFGLYLLNPFTQDDNTSMSIIIGLLILFIVGLKDDLTVIGPFTKLIAQFLACSFIFLDPDFQVHTLHDFIGIGQINTVLSIVIMAFLMLYIINAINLIDGIDGLAATVSIVILLVYGIMFFLMEQFYYLGLCLVGIGTLVAFLKYNLSKNSDRKIFMGDTGSMILGFVIALLSVRLLSYKVSELKDLPFYLENLPLVVASILIVPLFDTSRVFAIRVLDKRKPFSPDRNHIHHILIDYLKLSHSKASLLIALVNITFIALFTILAIQFDNIILLIIMISMIILFVYLFFRLNKSFRIRRKKYRQKQVLSNIKDKLHVF